VKTHLQFLVSVRVYSLIQWSNLQRIKHEDSRTGICCAGIKKPQTDGYLSSVFVFLCACHSLVYKTNFNVLNCSLITLFSQGDELDNEVNAASKTRWNYQTDNR
jgi:hypothetical protein